MAKVEVKMNSAGAIELLNSPEIQSFLLAKANAIKASADSMGSGKYDADVQPGKKRAHAMVKTTDTLSKASNRKHNSLLKAMNAGAD